MYHLIDSNSLTWGLSSLKSVCTRGVSKKTATNRKHKPFNKHEAIGNYARLKVSPTKAQLVILASSAVRN